MTFPFVTKLINKRTSKINKLGVKTLPIRCTSLPGFKHSHNVTRKKRAEYKTIYSTRFASFGKYGETAISNGTEAARGIPRPGPTER